jgi:CheY-like chemotaxis protein
MLPAPEAAPAPAARAAEPLRKPTDPRRVLLVEDNEDAATLLAEFIQLHGHEVVAAHDGASALALAERFQPDVAILDLGLPVMDGYELARRLEAQRRVRLIAVTGYGRDSDRKRTLEAGFEAHLAKPVELARLLSLVDKAGE